MSEQDAALQKISRFSRDGHTIEELHSEAWIVAHGIQESLGLSVDFGEESEQQLVLNGVRRRVAAPGKSRVGTLSVDQGNGENSAGTSLLSFLAASEDSDPLGYRSRCFFVGSSRQASLRGVNHRYLTASI